MRVLGVGVVLVGVLLVAPGSARAQVEDEGWQEELEPPVAFIEANGGWGVQFGETDYLPDGAAGEFQHPFVKGWSGGATAGWFFAKDLALFGSYEYRWAQTREGSITGVIDEVQGEVDYHTAVVGLRLYRPIGPGRLRAELGVGIVFPFETRLEYDWGDALAAAGITGTGTRVDEYGVGYGGQGALGYEVPVAGQFYVAGGLQVRTFQSNNDGEETRLENVVTDLTAMPPTATTATIEHGDGEAPPITNPVTDVTARLSVGVRF